jgi:hypothetical protein
LPQPNAPPHTPKKIKMGGNYFVCEPYFLKRKTAKFTKFNYVFLWWYKTTWEVLFKKGTSQLGFFN